MPEYADHREQEWINHKYATQRINFYTLAGVYWPIKERQVRSPNDDYVLEIAKRSIDDRYLFFYENHLLMHFCVFDVFNDDIQ